MECKICKCGAQLSNLGHECTSPFGVAVLAVFVPTLDSDGVRNGILKTQDLNKTFFDSMVNHADPSKRWYPTPQFKNVVDTRADAKFWEADDQTVEFVSEAARKFMALITQKSGSGATAPAMKKQIESARCSSGLSVFLISEGRQILVKESADGLSALPIEIDAQSVYAGFVKSTKQQNQHLALMFNFAVTENDGDLLTIECSEIDGYDILMLTALRNVCYDLIEVTDSNLKIKLVVKGFGSIINPYTVDGLEATDFVSSDSGDTGKIYDATTDADIAITDVTESPDGIYDLAVSSTIGDALVPFAKKTGYDFTCCKDNPVNVES